LRATFDGKEAGRPASGCWIVRRLTGALREEMVGGKEAMVARARTGGTLDRRWGRVWRATVVCCFWLLGTGLQAQPPEGPPLPSVPEAVTPPSRPPTAASPAPPAPSTAAPVGAPDALRQPLRARQVLTSAIEMCRRGEYDAAAQLFREVSVRQYELTTAEQQELQRWLQINTTAVQSRKQAVDYLGIAENLFKQGRNHEAAELLKKIAPHEQYLTESERARLTQLRRNSTVAGQPPAPSSAQLAARARLQQARLLYAQYRLDEAEATAREVEASRVLFADKEDTPAKLLAEIDKARKDPKLLLTASRQALGRGDLDQAEKLAGASEKASSTFTFTLSSDSPAKVRKEIQAAKAKATPAVPKETTPPAVDTTRKPDMLPPSAKAATNTRPEQPRETKPDPAVIQTGNKSPAAPAAKEEPAPRNAPAQTDTAAARILIQRARKALQEGDLAGAARLNEAARAKHPELNWWEDNPEKVAADIEQAAKKKGATEPAPASAEKTEKKAAATKGEAQSLLRHGREQLSAGKLDETAAIIQQVRALSGVRYGLFDDSPDKLQSDLNKARQKHDQETSIKVLAEARRAYEKNDFDTATKLAFQAQKLHGPYSVWDLGDRPNKLLEEIQIARNKPRKTNPLPVETVKNDRPAPGTPNAKGAPNATGTPSVPAGSPPRAQGTATAQNTSAPPGPGLPTPGNTGPAPAPTPAPVVDPNKTRALALLVEARTLQQQGQLLEARQKVVEVQTLRVKFTPDEETPEQMHLKLAAQARHQIDQLVQRATDLAGSNIGEATARYQQAEQHLIQARQLAVNFGLDAATVEGKLAWVDQLRKQSTMLASATTPGAPGAPSAPGAPGAPMPPGALQTVGRTNATDGQVTPQGIELLDQSRRALRCGDTAAARRLAEEAYEGNYGVKKQAAAMLRDIDVEEFNQQKLAANRAFDAALSAFNRRDYQHSYAILQSVEVRHLEPNRQAKLKDLMMSPEMARLAQPKQPAIAQTGPSGAPDTAQTGHSTLSPDAGVARATDSTSTPESDLLKTTKAMQEVKFQQVRQQSLRVQQEASDVLKAGDVDRALELLGDFLLTLPDSGLEADKIALIRRPIDSRQQQYRLLKAQKEFTDQDKKGREIAKNTRSKQFLAEQNKEQKLTELMKQYHTFYKEGKYKEAEMYATLAHEVDPDSTVAATAINMARIQRNVVASKKLKEDKEGFVVEELNEADTVGPAATMKDPLKFDPERSAISQKRPNLSTIKLNTRKSDAVREIERKLQTPVNMNFKDTPLKTVVDDLHNVHGINIVLDIAALGQENVNTDHPVTLLVEQLSLKSALNILLRQVKLTWVIRDDVLMITTESESRGKLTQVTYAVADLVIPVENYTATGQDLAAQISNNNAGSQPGSPQASPITGRFPLGNGTPTGTPSSSPGSPGSSGSANPLNGFATTGGQTMAVQKTQRNDTMHEALIKLITNTIANKSWADQGGPGTIDYFPLTMALVVNQTVDIQEQIAELLASLRRLQDQEVAIEIRVISVNESFYERIGVDFNINIKTDRETARFEPQLTNGAFKPAGFVQDFSPSRFIAGLSPTGTFTPDLDIPIKSGTFNVATPAFGGFIPGTGGIDVGLAFLSDVQVFLFMEAVQGDVRNHIMQAPKLTMFNGQTATITVGTQQNFLTTVTVTQGQNGLPIFTPIPNPQFAGATMTLQPVITADRRFVRLSPNITFFGITSGATLFPITIVVTPILDNGIAPPGPATVLTQYIQQPITSIINVTTTVLVPDGGTVMMGGLKLMAESRVEFGPPILSKLPYINRLFKNVAYGRDTQSLLIMVTPRIIISEEEEFRQTGYTENPILNPALAPR
jgi:type II secretory pathway component GspD/PulD (secretin)